MATLDNLINTFFPSTSICKFISKPVDVHKSTIKKGGGVKSLHFCHFFAIEGTWEAFSVCYWVLSVWLVRVSDCDESGHALSDLCVCSPLQHVPDYTRHRPAPHHWTPGLKLSRRTTGSCHTAGRRNSTGPDCYTAGSWTPPSAANAWTNTGDRGWIHTTSFFWPTNKDSSHSNWTGTVHSH